MAVRLQCEVDSWYLDEYKIEIHDLSYVGSVATFQTNLKDASLQLNGGAKDRLKTINTTDFKFTLLVENSSHELFWSDLAAEEEGRFFVVVSMKNKPSSSTSAYSMIFAGHLLIDESYLQNTGGGQFIELRAIDGLARLTDQEFKSDVTTFPDIDGVQIYNYWGMDTVLNIIYKCLDGLGTQFLYRAPYTYNSGLGNEFLWINHTWYEAQMGSITAESHFDWTQILQDIFTTRDDKGNYNQGMTRADVLEACLKPFHCRISYIFGSYIIENINYRGEDNKTFKVYNSYGAYVINKVESAHYHTISHPYVNNYYPLNGGKFGFLAPIKEACVTFTRQLGSYGYVPNFWSNTESSLFELGDVQVTSAETAIYCEFNINYTYLFTVFTIYSPSSLAIIYFGVKIKFGSYYYVTDVTSELVETITVGGQTINVYKDVFTNQWQLTEGYYLVATESKTLLNHTGKHTLAVKFTTAPLIEIGGVSPVYIIEDIDKLSVKVAFIQISKPLDYSQNIFTLDPVQTLTWSTSNFYLSPTEDDTRVLSVTAATKYCTEFNVNNSNKVEVNTVIGDAAYNSNNRVEVWTGAAFVNSSGMWGVNTLAGTSTLQELLLKEIINGQPYTLKRYLGTFQGMLDLKKPIDYDGDRYVYAQMTFDLFWRKWAGEWFQFVLTTDGDTITITNKETQADPTSGTISASGSNNPQNNNIPSQIIYPFTFNGADSVTIDFGVIPLPSTSENTEGQLNYYIVVWRNEALRMFYGGSNVQGYTLDNVNNHMILERKLRVGEFIKGHIIKAG